MNQDEQFSEKTDRELELEKQVQELEKQVQELEIELKELKSKKKDGWDKLSAIAPMISGLMIASIGAYFTYENSHAQIKLLETQTIERFIPHLLGSEQENKAAIIALSTLTNTEIAAKYAKLFPSEGTVSALKSIARSGTKADKEIASEALVHSYRSLGEKYRENRPTDAEVAFQSELGIQEQLVGRESPQLIDPMKRLAAVYKAEKKYGQARFLYIRILNILKQTGKSDSFDQLEAMKELATICALEGKPDSAIKYQREIIRLEELLANQKGDKDKKAVDDLDPLGASSGKTDLEPIPDDILPTKQDGGDSSKKGSDATDAVINSKHLQQSLESSEKGQNVGVTQPASGEHNSNQSETKSNLSAVGGNYPKKIAGVNLLPKKDNEHKKDNEQHNQPNKETSKEQAIKP